MPEQMQFPGMESSERQEGDPPEQPERTPEEEAELQRIQQKVEEYAEEHGYSGIEPAAEEDADEKPPRQEAMVGFLVFVLPDGKAVATSEINEALDNLTFSRPANTADMLYASLQVVEDVRAMHISQATAQAVVNTQMQISQQMQQQAEAQRLVQGLDLGHAVNPNRAQRRSR